ncbi:MAG: ASKHA domain-containing protein [Phycisphaerae bacterium]
MPHTDATTCHVLFEPSGLKTDVPRGATLLDAARRAGVYLTSICGGDGYCGKCKVVVNAGEVDAPPTTLLSQKETREGTVLACQAKVRSDLVVTVPKSHALDTGRIVVDSDAHRFSEMTGEEPGRGLFALDPLVRKLHLAMSPPNEQDQLADHERLYLAVRQQFDAPHMQTGFRILQQLPDILQKAAYDATAIVALRGEVAEVVDVEPGDTSGCNYAIVVDVGTTTVVAHLVDLTSATTVDAEATYNSQMHFGDDYIRRIMYAEEHDAFDDMQHRIVSDVNDLIQTIAVRQGIELGCITSLICAGNTAMIHFLLRLDARRIRRSPYVPAAAWVPPIRAAEAGIRINKRGLLYCLPAVGAYVGSDIVAGVLVTRLDATDGLNLFIDIGTNGEVVLAGEEWMMCASSSAGPAFEGSGIKHGMRAAPGAIERVSVGEDGRLTWRTIGDEPPRGLCGSGLLDALAAMLEAGVIDRTGRFTQPEGERFREGPDGLEYTLVPGEGDREPIVITQADVANLLRSKAGVHAAIEILMQMTGTDPNALESVYVAGGFGNYLDVTSAVTVGLLPDLPPERIHFVGNASIAGAKMTIMSRQAMAKAEELAGRMTYVDLMNHPDYMDAFTQANFLPHTDIARFPSVEKRLAGKAAKG